MPRKAKRQAGGLVTLAVAGAIVFGLLHHTSRASAKVERDLSPVHLGEAESAVLARLGKPDNQQHLQGVDFFHVRIHTTDFLWYGRYQLVFDNGKLTAKNRH